MPLVETRLYRLEDIAKGAITRGRVESGEVSDFSVAVPFFADIEEVELDNVEIPTDIRGILFENNIVISIFDDFPHVYETRININDEEWTSPEMSITAEAVVGTGTWTMGEGSNVYLMTGNEMDNFLGQNIDVNVQLRAKDSDTGDETVFVEAVNSIGILLR